MPTYLELRVELQHVQPAIWRRFLIRSDATFADVHEAIQAACGWQNKHLFCFYSGTLPIAGIPDEGDPRISNADLVRFAAGGRKSCTYVYDFGDEWRHEVILEGQQDLPEPFERRLIGGARAFPAEDCGGISGYEDCLAVIRGRGAATEEQRELLTWLGDWDPERFERERIARKFDRPRRRKVTGA